MSKFARAVSVLELFSDQVTLLTAEDIAAAFDAFLHSLGYPFVEETANPVYALFLR